MGSGSACMERTGTSRSCPSGPARQVAGRHVVGQPDAVGGLVEGVAGRPETEPHPDHRIERVPRSRRPETWAPGTTTVTRGNTLCRLSTGAVANRRQPERLRRHRLRAQRRSRRLRDERPCLRQREPRRRPAPQRPHRRLAPATTPPSTRSTGSTAAYHHTMNPVSLVGRRRTDPGGTPTMRLNARAKAASER